MKNNNLMKNGVDLSHPGRSWLRRLNVRVMFIFAVLLLLAMVAFTLFAIHKESDYIQRIKERQVLVMADHVIAALANDLRHQNKSAMKATLQQFMQYSDITSLQLFDTSGELLAGSSEVVSGKTQLVPIPQLVLTTSHVIGDSLVVWHPATVDTLQGWLRLTSSLQSVAVMESRYWRNNIFIGVLILLVAGALLMLILRKPVATFERYTDFAERLEKKEGRQVEVSTSSDEMHKMGHALNRTSITLYDQDQSIKYAMRRLKGLAAFPRWNPNIVLSMNKNADVQYINPRGTLILRKHGLSTEDIKQLAPENINELVSWCHTENKTVRDVETKFEGRVFSWTVSPVEGDDLLHCYGLEITDRIHAQEEARAAQIEKHSAEAASQAKSAFLAHMSHEIRTPLTAIIGFSETLYDSHQNETDRLNAINIIIRSSRHLLHIINEILDLSKIEAEKLEIDLQPTNLFQLVSDVAPLIELQARDKGLDFNIQYQYPLPDSIHTDVVRLKQILINVCNNAVKFTEQGDVRIDIGCDKTEECIYFDISDTGIGMNPDQSVKLFHAFTQADTSISREYGGTGLGLHLSKKLAEKLGGDISLTSTEGKGSCFRVTIATGSMAKVNWLTESPVQLFSESVSVTELSRQVKGRVLVAEDNGSNQQLIQLYLEKLGATATIVDNGALAVKQALDGEYDLVLMDMQMPVMDGLKATALLRKRGYTGPIVALTANTMDEDIRNCHAAGSDDFISKPIDRQRFRQVLCHYLEESAGDDAIVPLMSGLLANDADFDQLVQAFVAQLPTIIEELHTAHTMQNWADMSDKLHDLKSLGGGYGFPQLSELAKDMEHDLARENYKRLPMSLREMDMLHTRIKAGMRTEQSTIV